jgi:hypothetical protein
MPLIEIKVFEDELATSSAPYAAARREDSELRERIHVALRELAPTHNVEYRVIDAERIELDEAPA